VRRLLPISAFFLGFLASVAIAWLCVARCDRTEIFVTCRTGGFVGKCVEIRRGTGVEYARDAGLLFRLKATSLESSPYWSRFRGKHPLNDVEMEEAGGWPFRCALWYHTSREIHWGFDPSGKGAAPAYAGITRVYPMCPIWPGLLADTLIYSLVVYLPLALARAGLRRVMARFRRDGMCHTCGYSRDGLQTERCPECGALWKPHSGQTEPSPLRS
jgi:hypothetical protein